MEWVVREGYLDWLRQWRDKPVIKVVTGVRRCGKSTLLRQFRDELTAGGVDDRHIVFIDLEDMANSSLLAGPQALHDYVQARCAAEGNTYVFIDEAQLVDEFEKAVASLNNRPGVDLYITGSNASMLSSDLATRLTGRYVQLSILPLSFAEWRGSRPDGQSSLDEYRHYAQYGGFPFTAQLADQPSAVTQYLEGVLDTIVTRDVAVRRNVANMSALLSVVRFTADNIGNLTSTKRIADTLVSMGRKVTAPTVDSYLDGLVGAYLLYPAHRYDIRGKGQLERVAKYYIVDPGLRTALLGLASPDHGRVLENIVYLELLRRQAKVYVGKIDGTEVDFVVESNGRTQYIQVAETVADETTLRRELGPLQKVPDFNQRLLLTLDPVPPASHDGIEQIYAPDWLAGDAA